MKKLTSMVVGGAFLLNLLAFSAYAAHRRADDDEGGTNVTFGFGVETGSYIAGTSSGLGADIGIGDRADIEVLFGMSLPTGGTLNLGTGLLGKYTVVGGRSAGFHLGGGVGFGTNGSFAFTLPILAGFHFAVPGVPQISVCVDAGALLAITTPAGAAQVGFGIGPASSLLGLGLFYNF